VAETLPRSLAAEVDAVWPRTEPTRIPVTMCWPPYRLGDDLPLKTALLTAAPGRPLARGEDRRAVEHRNYLASLGIEATAGFGVEYQGLHGTDECIRIDSTPPVQAPITRPAWPS
jgi:succinyl-diaminopimelate desuccinylase